MLKVLTFMKQVAAEATDGGKLWYCTRLSKQSECHHCLSWEKRLCL